MLGKLFEWMPGFSTIKTWAIAGMAVAIPVLFALWKMSQFGRIKDKIKGIKNARDTESRTADAIIEGLQYEKESTDNLSHNRTDMH
ncbi:MAG: hypothetical protein BMS9Abin31_0493 [Gammaproteobacteria bacterium]|nr:MAG: hypothetical protein BMS9Abin31_0493 [Gammaproteobacteria bacterium]